MTEAQRVEVSEDDFEAGRREGMREAGRRLRAYAEALRVWGCEVGKVDVRGSHAIHDGAHYLHAAVIAEGHEPEIQETFDVTIDSEWLQEEAGGDG